MEPLHDGPIQADYNAADLSSLKVAPETNSCAPQALQIRFADGKFQIFANLLDVQLLSLAWPTSKYLVFTVGG